MPSNQPTKKKAERKGKADNGFVYDPDADLSLSLATARAVNRAKMLTPTRPKRAAKKGSNQFRNPNLTESRIRVIVREELATRAGTVPSEPTKGEIETLAKVLCKAWNVLSWDNPSLDRDSFRNEARAAIAHLRSKP